MQPTQHRTTKRRQSDVGFPITVRKTLRRCLGLAKKHMTTTQPVWGNIVWHLEAACSSDRRIQHPPAKNCPFAKEIIEAFQKITHLLLADIQSINELPASERQARAAEVQQLTVFISEAMKATKEIAGHAKQVRAFDRSYAIAAQEIAHEFKFLNTCLATRYVLEPSYANTHRSRSQITGYFARRRNAKYGVTLDLKEKAKILFTAY